MDTKYTFSHTLTHSNRHWIKVRNATSTRGQRWAREREFDLSQRIQNANLLVLLVLLCCCFSWNEQKAATAAARQEKMCIRWCFVFSEQNSVYVRCTCIKTFLGALAILSHQHASPPGSSNHSVHAQFTRSIQCF